MVALKPYRRAARSMGSGLKQERRGGIETVSSASSPAHKSAKQERRGGIETVLTIISSIREPTKQERRGGIETSMGMNLKASRGVDEAGTPWWH